MERIKAHLLEAEKVLKAFYSEEKNIQAIYDAGQVMIESIKNGNKKT